jgi:hypothetical protein
MPILRPGYAPARFDLVAIQAPHPPDPEPFQATRMTPGPPELQIMLDILTIPL